MKKNSIYDLEERTFQFAKEVRVFIKEKQSQTLKMQNKLFALQVLLVLIILKQTNH